MPNVIGSKALYEIVLAIIKEMIEDLLTPPHDPSLDTLYVNRVKRYAPLLIEVNIPPSEITRVNGALQGLISRCTVEAENVSSARIAKVLEVCIRDKNVAVQGQVPEDFHVLFSHLRKTYESPVSGGVFSWIGIGMHLLREARHLIVPRELLPRALEEARSLVVLLNSVFEGFGESADGDKCSPAEELRLLIERWQTIVQEQDPT